MLGLLRAPCYANFAPLSARCRCISRYAAVCTTEVLVPERKDVRCKTQAAARLRPRVTGIQTEVPLPRWPLCEGPLLAVCLAGLDSHGLRPLRSKGLPRETSSCL